MAKAARRDDLVWQDVDTDKFKGPMLKAFKAMKDARAVARSATQEFENMFRKEAEKKLTDGTSVLIAHRFGKMAIAMVDKSELSKDRSKPAEKFTL